ncbi:MFS transporter [Variovorax sp. H27-G14]|uniref:MFS transporter n=1 Tax=Variovorax sp. H27-G14 TaxID=3111914 RepID=UPI0038FCEC09
MTTQGDNLAGASLSTRSFLNGLVCLSLLMGLSIGYSRVVTTLYAVKMDASGWMLAALAMSQSVGMLVLATSAGRWVDVYGVRVVFVVGSAWAMLMCLLTPLVPTFWALLLFSAAASLAMPPRFVSINTIFMSRLRELGKQRAGWFRAAHVVGMTFLGAVLATTLFPLHGPVFAFWGAAAIFALNIAVFLLGIGHGRQPELKRGKAGERGTLAQLFKAMPARRVAIWEFSIQSLNAYFAFYIVIIVLRYLHLPERTAGFVVATQGLAFVLTLVTAGRLVVGRPRASRILGGLLVVSALIGLAVSRATAETCIFAAVLGSGLGLLQIINLTEFAILGETIGFSQAATINALAGPCGGLFGGLLGGLLEHWIAPQSLFLAFIPLFILLILIRPGKKTTLGV